jgi:hypothetical protein
MPDPSPHWLREIETFFATSKTLQEIHTDVRGGRGAEAARAAIAACRVADPPAVRDPDESTASASGRDPA